MSNTDKSEIILYKDFNPEKLDFDAPEEKRTGAAQLLSYPVYKGNTFPPLIQLPWITLETYGIPSKDSKFHDTPDKRMYIKTPLRTEYLNIDDPDHVNKINQNKILVEKLKLMDTKFCSDTSKEKFFNKKKDKYTYEPCFRSPQEQDDEDDEVDKNKKKSNSPILNYLKVKIDIDYISKEFKSAIYESKFDTEQNKDIRNRFTPSSIDDIANMITWKSNVRMVIKASHMWAQPAKIKDPKYGIVFKLVKIEVKKSNNLGGSIDYNKDDFIDEENNNKSNIINSDIVEIESDDDDEIIVKSKDKNSDIFEIESDDDDEIIVKSKDRKSNIVEIESDDDDEIIVKSKDKKSDIVEIESDDDDEIIVKSKDKKSDIVEIESDDEVKSKIDDSKTKKNAKKTKK